MNKITSFLDHKRNIAGFGLLAILVFNTYSIQENSGSIKKLANFESGIQTCFTRVNQTYTAKMLGDTTSNYLTQNFQNFTEECFAESILNLEDTFKSELSQVSKKLSTLSSNVHWFHEDILSPGSVQAIANNNESRDIGVRFEKIETRKDEILETSENYKNELANSLSNEKTIFYISATFLVILMFSEFMNNIRRRLANTFHEKEAQAELIDNGGTASVKVGEIIKSALEQNNLINCSKLFTNYHASQLFDKQAKNKSKFSIEGLITPIGAQNPVTLNETIDKIWNNDNIGITSDSVAVNNFQDLNLEMLTSSTINLLAEKLFSRGIQIDVKIAENISIKGRQEELEQTLYHLINYAINSTQEVSGEKNISIFAHRLGDIVTFDLIHSGIGHDEEILKQRVGISNLGKSLDVDLQICQSLLAEIEAKIQLDNKINQNGDTVGGRVKIIFKTVNKNTAQLVDLKVGSKKEILASFGLTQNSTEIN